MTISSLLQYTKYRPINIFHLEDDEDWLEIVEDNILGRFDWHYIYHKCGTILELREKLNQYPSLAILIIDLKLAKPIDDIQGLAWLLRNIVALKNNKVQIFVLSGFLKGPTSLFNHFLLNYNEIPDDNLYQKLNFEEDQFAASIEVTARNLIEDAIKPLHDAHKDAILEIDAYIANTNCIDDVYQVYEGVEYLVNVTITSLKELKELAGKSLKIYCYSLETNISPSLAEILIPSKLYELKTINFRVSFFKEEAPDIRDFFVVIFYGNNLLRMFEMRMNISFTRETDNLPSTALIREYV